MIARTALVIATLLFAVSTHSTSKPTFAQTTTNQEARKFEEFGDIYASDKAARLDAYAMQLLNESSMKGFIIVYRSRRDLFGSSNRTALGIKYYLVNSRGIDAARLLTVDGGVAQCFTTELWIMPTGATPKPRDDGSAYQLTDIESTYKFDEFQYPGAFEGEGSYIGSFESELGNLEGYAATLRKLPRARAYIIAYAQYYAERTGDSYTYNAEGKSIKRVYRDSPNEAQKILKAEKDHLVKTYHIAASRIVIVDGGYRERRDVELWIVPRGQHAPIATPNAFPKQRAKRRTMQRR